MKNIINTITVSFMVCLFFAISFFIHTATVSAHVDEKFGDPIKLLSPIRSVAIYDSTYGEENGKDVMYTTVSGNPAIFQVIDLESKEVLRTYPLEGSESSWSHITVPDGTVYIGGNGKLYEYSPETLEVKDLGGIGESVVYGLSYDEEGRVYFGSYPNAKAGSYDPKTGEMRDYGSVAPGQSYTRSTAYHNGFLYLGVGTDNHLVKLNVDTGDYEKIDLPSNIVHGSSVWQLDTAGKYIVAGVGGGDNALLFYDTEVDDWSEKYYLDNKGLRLIHGKPGSNKAYFLQKDQLKEIDLETLDATDTGVTFGTFMRNTAWVKVPHDPDFPGLSLVTVKFDGGVTFVNLETKKVKTVEYPIVGNPIPIQTLEKGPDDNLYLSGYPGGTAAAYNPMTGVSQDFSLGQAEGMAAIGDKMYFGVYPGATIFESDVTKPTIEPKKLYDIPNHNRPFIMTPAKGKLFIGTIPDYGHLGGSLTVLDPTDPKNTVVYENVVHNQAIAGLAEKDGKLYGSTTVAGGLGIDPTESAAKLFVWDIKNGEKLEEFIPEIPGATMQPDMISGMSLGPDGLLWSAADGTIFALDPETLEIVKSKNIYPEVTNYGKWRPVHIRWDEDGLMYTTLAGKLTVIDPESFAFETLASTELMTIGSDSAIYYAAGTNLMKIEVGKHVTTSSLKASVDQFKDNGQFENDHVAHDLTIHLNAVSQFEKKELEEKVVKHMKGFILLLDHQLQEELISENAHHHLKNKAELMIRKWK